MPLSLRVGPSAEVGRHLDMYCMVGEIKFRTK